MAFTDLLVGAVLDTLWGVYSVYGALSLDDKMACHLYLGLEYLISFATPSGLLAIAIDRAWEARWPAHHFHHSSHKCAFFSILTSWMYPIIIWGPAFTWDRLRHPYKDGDCFFDHENHEMLTYLLAVFGYVMPMLAALVIYSMMVFTIYVQRPSEEKEENVVVQRDRLASIVSTMEGFTVPELSLFVQQPVNPSISPPDNTSEASVMSSASDIHDFIFFTHFRDDELMAARFEHHLERRSFYLLTAKLLVYLFSWSPYFVTFFCAAGGNLSLPSKYVMFSVWNTYINAAVNPILTIISGEHVSIHIQHMMNDCKNKFFGCLRAARSVENDVEGQQVAVSTREQFQQIPVISKSEEIVRTKEK